MSHNEGEPENICALSVSPMKKDWVWPKFDSASVIWAWLLGWAKGNSEESILFIQECSQTVPTCHVRVVELHRHRRMAILNSTIKVWLLTFWEPQLSCSSWLSSLQHFHILPRGGEQVQGSCLASQQPGTSGSRCRMRSRTWSQQGSDRIRRRCHFCVTASPYLKFIMNYHFLFLIISLSPCK